MLRVPCLSHVNFFRVRGHRAWGTVFCGSMLKLLGSPGRSTANFVHSPLAGNGDSKDAGDTCDEATGAGPVLLPS